MHHFFYRVHNILNVCKWCKQCFINHPATATLCVFVSIQSAQCGTSQEANFSALALLQQRMQTTRSSPTVSISLLSPVQVYVPGGTLVRWARARRAPGIFLDPCPTGGLLGGALRGRT